MPFLQGKIDKLIHVKTWKPLRKERGVGPHGNACGNVVWLKKERKSEGQTHYISAWDHCHTAVMHLSVEAQTRSTCNGCSERSFVGMAVVAAVCLYVTIVPRVNIGDIDVPCTLARRSNGDICWVSCLFIRLLSSSRPHMWLCRYCVLTSCTCPRCLFRYYNQLLVVRERWNRTSRFKPFWAICHWK